MREILEKEKPRVWLKAFWGFDPSEEGYLGFTKAGDQLSFISEAKNSDLVLIYGSTSEETDIADRRQALGFLEINPTPIKDTDRMSEAAKINKAANGWRDRWTYAVPVTRAWRIKRQIEVKNIAPDTYIHQRARRIASRGELLSEKEAEIALSLPVVEINVYGQPLISQEPEKELINFFNPSRGIPTSFGDRIVSRPDGEHFLYMLVADGNVASLLDISDDRLERKS